MRRNSHETNTNMQNELKKLKKIWAVVTFGSARPTNDLRSAEKLMMILDQEGADPKDIENALHSGYLQADEWESEE